MSTDPNPNKHAEHRFPTCSKNGQFLIYERPDYNGLFPQAAAQHTDVYRLELGTPAAPAPAAQGLNLTDCYVDTGFYYANDYPDLAPGDTYIVYRTAGYSGNDFDYEIAKAPADACDESGLQPTFPQYLTGCVPQAQPGQSQQPGSPICPDPNVPDPDGNTDTDPDWGEM